MAFSLFWEGAALGVPSWRLRDLRSQKELFEVLGPPSTRIESRLKATLLPHARTLTNFDWHHLKAGVLPLVLASNAEVTNPTKAAVHKTCMLGTGMQLLLGCRNVLIYCNSGCRTVLTFQLVDFFSRFH